MLRIHTLKIAAVAAALLSTMASSGSSAAAGNRVAAAPAAGSSPALATVTGGTQTQTQTPSPEPKLKDDVATACVRAQAGPVAARAADLKPGESVRSRLTGMGWQDCTEPAKDICARAARREVDDQRRLDVLGKGGAAACMRINAGTTAAGADVGAAVLQSIAQVVATKAEAAGWQVLRDSLENAAHCDDANTPFSGTCKVLGTLSIKDLVSSPGVLISAVVADLMKQLRDKDKGAATAIAAVAPVAGDALIDATGRWAQSGAPGIVVALRNDLIQAVMDNAQTECTGATTAVQKYQYVLEMCLAQTDSLDKCIAATYIAECDGPAAVQLEVRRLWDLTLRATAKIPPAKPIDVVNLAFAFAADEVDEGGASPEKKKLASAYLAGAKDLVSGLVQVDWVQATTGGVEIVDTVESTLPPCAMADAACPLTKKWYDDERTLLKVIAAVGNYALTFDTANLKDPATAAATREKIITELVDRMVNRTDRTGGWVFSLGGAVGALGGTRFAQTDKLRADWAFPVQLTLGVGLQSYGPHTGGFHAMLSAFDLGQYVNMNSPGALQVATPSVESSIAAGVTVGGWFALRETPLYVAAQGSVAPFNQAGGNPTFQAGLVSGIYVPLLDFN